MKPLAAGSQLEDGPTGHQLTWPGGEATFVNRYQAVTFSWAINADPDTIVASYQHVNGQPLFDLGIPVDEWSIHTARGRPGGRVAQPRVETPPPDDEGAADRAAIDAMLADRRWERRAPSGWRPALGRGPVSGPGHQLPAVPVRLRVDALAQDATATPRPRSRPPRRPAGSCSSNWATWSAGGPGYPGSSRTGSLPTAPSRKDPPGSSSPGSTAGPASRPAPRGTCPR